MTDPDPHSFVLSRRAWRDTGVWPTTDAAPKPPAGATRRGLREPAPSSQHVDAIPTSRGPLLAPPEEFAKRARSTRAVASTRSTAAQRQRRLRRSTVEPPSPEPAAAPAPHPPSIAMRRTAASSAPHQPGVAMRRTAASSEPQKPPARTPASPAPGARDELLTPVWDAITHRPDPQPNRVQRAPRDAPALVEGLPDDAEWSPIWAAITRIPASGASARHPATQPEEGDSAPRPAETVAVSTKTTTAGVPPGRADTSALNEPASGRADTSALDEPPAAPPRTDSAISPSTSPERSTPSDEIVGFVMPRPGWSATAARSAIPPILRPPPAPVSAPLEPLLPAYTPIRHARRRARKPIGLGMAATAAAAAAALVLGGSVGVTAAVTGTPVSTIARNVVVAVAAIETSSPSANPAPAASPPAAAAPTSTPTPQATPAAAVVDPCTTPATVAALQAGDDAAVIAAMGGADALRAAVAAAGAPCIDLGDPARVWVVVDKTRPLDPIDYAPASLAAPDGVRSLEGGELRQDAAAAMSAMVSAAAQAGVGELGLLSAYRSYDTQVTSFGNQVSDRGAESAELVSARPGYSEHQTGLAVDLVPCDAECGTLDDLAGSVQGQWVAAHAWEFGWIVRYEAGHTGVTGYSPEAWHLRYIGVELARSYHAGGWHTLEEFFALPAAPDYVD